MIIEFIGLPGSGKSYFAKQLEDKLDLENIKCKNITEFSRNTIVGKIIKKTLYKTININLNIKKYRDCIENVLDNKNNLKSVYHMYNSYRNCTNALAILIYLYNKLGNSKKIYIFDEGLMHWIVKMGADFELNENIVQSIIEIVKKLLINKNNLVIYNQIEIEDCKKSLLNRNRHVCAFDELKSEDLDNILEQYYKMCKIIKRKCNTLEINRFEEDNIKLLKVMNKIKSEV